MWASRSFIRGRNDSGLLIMQHETIENYGNFRAVLEYGLRMTSVGNSDLELIRERCNVMHSILVQKYKTKLLTHVII